MTIGDVREVVGRKVTKLDPAAVRARASEFEHVLVDVGTGVGNALLRRARREPGTFFIGVDAAADNLREASDRAQRQPARGGVGNLVFVVAAANDLPGDLAGIADEVTVVLPWGSLLQVVLLPDPVFVSRLQALLKPKGTVEMLVSVGESDVGAGSIDFDETRARALAADYDRLGLKPTEIRLAEAADVDRLGSSWGRRLAIPRRRQAWILRFAK
jgi:16S rRNA (adenine(1408)-N(1))-methyltransferase